MPSLLASWSPSTGDCSAEKIGDDDVWIEVERLERDVVLERGGQTFIRFHNDTGQLSVTDELHFYEALSDEAQQAVDRAPDWLRDNLSRKLSYAGIRSFDTNEVDIAFGDLDGDGCNDFLSVDLSDMVFYRNCGTRLASLFREERSLFEIGEEFAAGILKQPSLGDLDGDGDMDLVAVMNGETYIFENVGSRYTPIFDFISTGTIPNSFSPHLADLNGDGFADIVHGRTDGTMEYWVNEAGGNLDEFRRNPLVFTGIDVGSYALPAGGDMDDDGDIDLVVGSGSTVLHYFENLGTPRDPIYSIDDLTLFAGIDADTYLDPCMVSLDTDELLDLVLTTSLGRALFYDNIGTSTAPDFRISSTYDVWPGMSYYPPNDRLRVVSEERISPLIDLLLSCPDHLVDEIAFSIANTADDVLLRGEVSSSMFLENARYVYEAASHLDYVELVENGSMESGDYHTTTRYRVLEDGIEKSVLLPREIYYRFVVHPKVTEENPCFIDPDTGSPAPPDPQGQGRFWREYLFDHNDSSYPPDPDPDDDRDMYPTDSYPPLMKDVLSGIEYLYNGTTWHAPGGRPVLYGEHAIIRVSNWVGKTLVLNQQEVSDDERPVQPVRIAHHHNGNCGELQDLTIAAARCALIPASGVIMLGEDHVWIEFWERGWHQWDNYWSDGGSIIDNWDNYWYGWGGRGGSGIYKWHGNDRVEDVTTHYVPREMLSDVVVTVTDRTGAPVDGARVVIGSHWMLEHQTDTPVTAPFPSIWNYTDSDGIARFTLTSNNISVKVISRLGNGAVTKTYIEPGTRYDFNVTLEGRKPRVRPKVREVDYAEGEDWRIEYDLRVDRAFQRPPNANTGSFHTRPIPGGLHCDFVIFPGSEIGRVLGNHRADCYDADLDVQRSSGTLAPLDGDDVYFCLSSCDQVETYKKVRIEMRVLRKMEGKPFVSIRNPGAEDVFTVDEDIVLRGTAADEHGIAGLNLTLDGVVTDIFHGLSERDFSYTLTGGTLAKGEHTAVVRARNVLGVNSTARVRFHVSDLVPPSVRIRKPMDGSSYTIGTHMTVGGSVDGVNISVLELKVQGDELTETFDILDSLGEDGEFEYGMNTTGYTEGRYNLTVKAVDHTHLRGMDTVGLRLSEMKDTEFPSVSMTGPENYAGFTIGDMVEIHGLATDNAGIVLLSLYIDQSEGIDITGYLAGNEYEYELDTSDWKKGSHEIKVNAADKAGNEAQVSRMIVLKEPIPREIEPPKILFLAPAQFEVVEFGQVVVIRASVSSEVPLISLEFSLDWGRSWENGIEGYNRNSGRFTYELNSSELRTGPMDFILRAEDEDGRMAEETLVLEIRDTRAPEVRITNPSEGDTILLLMPSEGEDHQLIGTLAITVEVFDLSEIRDMKVELEGAGIRRVFRERRPDLPVTFEIKMEELETGQYTVTARATDADGNEGEHEVTFTVKRDEAIDETREDSGSSGKIWLTVVVVFLLGAIGLAGTVYWFTHR